MIRSRLVGDRSAEVITLVRALLVLALCAVSLAFLAIFFSAFRVPGYFQPALAAPTFCFLRNIIARELQPDLTFEVSTIALLGWMGTCDCAWGCPFIIMFGRRHWSLDFVIRILVILLHVGVLIIAAALYMVEWGFAQPYIDQATSENTWGFGQIVAVFLLLVPVMTFFGALTGRLYQPANFTSIHLLLASFPQVLFPKDKIPPSRSAVSCPLQPIPLFPLAVHSTLQTREFCCV